MPPADPLISLDGSLARPAFLEGGGEMGHRIAAYDWALHPFGSPETWPATLKVATSLCLHSSFATTLYWGPEFRLIYNDATIDAVGPHHPAALGEPGAIARREAWTVTGPLVERVFEVGEGVAGLGLRVPTLGGDTYWTYSLSPLRDENGVVVGVLGQGHDTTARVEAEAALRASDERLQMALDASGNVGTWEWDLTSDTVVGDARTARLYGVDPALARSGAPAAVFLQHVHPEDYAGFGALMQRSFAGDDTLAADYRLVLPDEEVRWLAVRGRLHAGSDGRPARFAGVSLDITDPKRHEAELYRRSEEREFILDLAERQRAQHEPDDVMQLTSEAVARRLGIARAGFFSVDADEIIQYGACWTDGTLPPLVGTMPSALFGKKLGDTIRNGRTLVFGAPGAPLSPLDAALEATGTRAGVSVPLVREGRWEGCFYLSSTVQRDWAAHEVALVEEAAQLCWDAAARVRAVATLRAINARLSGELTDRDRIWEVSQDMLGIASIDGTWRSVNPAWTRLLGWSEEELVGRTSEWLTHPDDNARTRTEIETRGEGGSTTGFVNRFRTQGGDYRTLSWTAVQIDGRIYATAQDVTAQRELEDRLRQAQKMEAVGQLTGGLAHDFNNLLTGISGAMEMMQLRLKQGRIDDLPRYIGAAQTAAGRAAALTHRLLAFSRRQPLDPRATDVARLIDGMEDLIRGTVGPDIELVTIAPDGLWPTLVDANQLENALLNLCINARDAMPGGGTITVEAANLWVDGEMGALRDLVPGAYLTLCVTDTGTGMTPEILARAFDPFFTTKPMGQGTGLGLSMIYGFARQSGGQVRIESTLGEGSMICLYLPRHHGALGDAETAIAGGGVGTVGTGETVLLVEDEPAIRMLVGELLGDLGYRAIEASDGREALKVIESAQRIDLLITDVGLPGGMNGREVADAARRFRPGLKVLFITGYAENAVVGGGPLEAGCELVTKPFTIETLAARVQEMIGVP